MPNYKAASYQLSVPTRLMPPEYIPARPKADNSLVMEKRPHINSAGQ